MEVHARVPLKNIEAPKSIQGEHSFYHHSHCNLTQLPSCIATHNDKITIACRYLIARTQEATESIEGEHNYNNHSHGDATQLPIITTMRNGKLTCGYFKTQTQEKLEHAGTKATKKTYEEKTTIIVAAMAGPWNFPPQRLR